MNVWISKDLGQYNWAGGGKDWKVTVRTPFGFVEEFWPEDSEPCIEDELPSAVLEMIEARLADYWICSRKDESLRKISEIRKNMKEVDSAWINGKIQNFETKIEHLRRVLDEVNSGDD